MASLPLRIVAFVQPMITALMVFVGCLRGAGDMRFPMFVTAFSMRRNQ
jgi:Na+-driven multidrug efflux pump